MRCYYRMAPSEFARYERCMNLIAPGFERLILSGDEACKRELLDRCEKAAYDLEWTEEKEKLSGANRPVSTVLECPHLGFPSECEPVRMGMSEPTRMLIRAQIERLWAEQPVLVTQVRMEMLLEGRNQHHLNSRLRNPEVLNNDTEPDEGNDDEHGSADQSENECDEGKKENGEIEENHNDINDYFGVENFDFEELLSSMPGTEFMQEEENPNNKEKDVIIDLEQYKEESSQESSRVRAVEDVENQPQEEDDDEDSVASGFVRVISTHRRSGARPHIVLLILGLMLMGVGCLPDSCGYYNVARVVSSDIDCCERVMSYYVVQCFVRVNNRLVYMHTPWERVVRICDGNPDGEYEQWSGSRNFRIEDPKYEYGGETREEYVRRVIEYRTGWDLSVRETWEDFLETDMCWQLLDHLEFIEVSGDRYLKQLGLSTQNELEEYWAGMKQIMDIIDAANKMYKVKV